MNTQKEILAAENEFQICSGQLDTFNPYWDEKAREQRFLLTMAFPQNQR